MCQCSPGIFNINQLSLLFHVRGGSGALCAGSGGPRRFCSTRANLRARREPSLALASFPPLPLATGVEQELVCLWKFPVDPWLFCKLSFLLWARRRLLCCCLLGKYLMEKESLSPPGSWQGESKARDLRLWERGDRAVLWSECSSVCSQQVDVFSLCYLQHSCLFFPSRCLNTPEISIGLPRTGICEGIELPPRMVSLLRLQ